MHQLCRPDKMLFSIRSNLAATFSLGPALGSATTASSSSLLVLYLQHHSISGEQTKQQPCAATG